MAQLKTCCVSQAYGGGRAARPRAQRRASTGRATRYILRLFVCGMTPRSASAIENIRQICHDFLEEQCELQVFDVRRRPQLAKAEQIVCDPTLVKTWPLPERRLVGDLRDHERVLAALDLPTSWAPAVKSER